MTGRDKVSAGTAAETGETRPRHLTDERGEVWTLLTQQEAQDRLFSAAAAKLVEKARPLPEPDHGALIANPADVLDAAARALDSSYDPKLRAVGAELADFVKSPRGRTLEVRLGVRRRGGAQLADDLERKRRDQLLRDVRAAVGEWTAAGDYRAARLMWDSVQRYQSTRWARDRAAGVCPEAEPGRTWFLILSTGGKIPGLERLAQILKSN